jgi:hypothetical protein
MTTIEHLLTILKDPDDASVRRAGAPLNLCERIRMGVLRARGCILSADQECELYDLVERDRSEDRKR